MRLLILLLLFITKIGHSQIIATTSQNSNTVQSETYIIGIGNSDNSLYNDVLNYLQNASTIDVINSCQSHKVISFKVLNSEFKSYDVIRNHLKDLYDNLILLRKNEDIFSLDCKDEIKKQ